MNIFKRRISLILSLVMLALVILPIFAVNASSAIEATVKVDSKTIDAGDTIKVEGGETIEVTLSSDEASISLFGYKYGKDAEATQVKLNAAKTHKIKLIVPTGEPGTEKELRISAAGKTDNNELVQLQWQGYTLKYPSEEVSNKDVNIKYNSKVLANKSTTNVFVGDTVTFTASPASEVEALYYNWTGKEGDWMQVTNASSYTIEFPSTCVAGSEQALYINARFTDGELYNKTPKGYLFKFMDEEPQVSMVVTLDGKTMTEDGTYTVNGGEKIKAVAKSTVAEIDFIGYRYVVDGVKSKITDVQGDTLEVTVPTGEPGTVREIRIEAVADNDDGSANTITKTGWISFNLEYAKDEVIVPPTPEMELDTSHNGSVLTNGSTTVGNPGESVKIVATPTEGVSRISFRWDNDAWSVANGQSTYTTRIPSTFAPNTTHTLHVKATYNTGKEVEKSYKFTIPAAASEITMNVKLDSKTIKENYVYAVVGGEEINVAASCTGSTVSYIEYRIDKNATKKVSGNTATITVPDGDVDETFKVYINAVAVDGTSTGEKVYGFKFVEDTDNDGKLDIEPWMEENDETEQLSISLRNDSEEDDKANKNIYALSETVTYYIDYKNGSSKDIDSDLKIELTLPLEFTVVDKNGGSVDSDEGTITWTLKGGLEEGEAGTIIVKVKYDKFTKSKYDSETIYPVAKLLQGKKEKDISSVINLIIAEYDEELDIEHEPYMYGDADADTFRPDDSITRAEGALVLARIYGLNYQKTKVTDVFSDLDETYLDAQKAIIAATNAGLVSGYTDGTYRPNATMTRAEFMTILARMVDRHGEDEEIEGLNIKEVDELIKVYADSTRYYIVDGKKVYSHWALEEVSLLARLNMTPLSEENDEIELDEEITRAEVAQLVNFYLLRAPASVSSKTDSGFSDVKKRHELYADIIEATREAHTFSIDSEDGTEIEE